MSEEELNARLADFVEYTADETISGEIPSVDADYLGGYPASDYQMADRVVEAGISGIWSYRKWASGYLECWGNHEVSDIAINNAWGGIYYGYAEGIAFPVTFTGIPVMEATINTQTTGTVFLGTGAGSSWSKISAVQTGAFVLFRGTSGTSSGVISISARGRYI